MQFAVGCLLCATRVILKGTTWQIAELHSKEPHGNNMKLHSKGPRGNSYTQNSMKHNRAISNSI